ncbi:hypothetical protein ACJX0J_036354, partial [Zea mays]
GGHKSLYEAPLFLCVMQSNAIVYNLIACGNIFLENKTFMLATAYFQSSALQQAQTYEIRNLQETIPSFKFTAI